MTIEVKPKKFIVVPRDAFEVLHQKHAALDDAVEAAEAFCSESGQTAYVLELKAVAARADRPVKVRRL